MVRLAASGVTDVIVVARSAYYPRLLVADVSGDASQSVAFSTVDERGQPGAHLSTTTAMLRITAGCHANCIFDRITRWVDVAQKAGVWPCWQVARNPLGELVGNCCQPELATRVSN